MVAKGGVIRSFGRLLAVLAPASLTSGCSLDEVLGSGRYEVELVLGALVVCGFVAWMWTQSRRKRHLVHWNLAAQAIAPARKEAFLLPVIVLGVALLILLVLNFTTVDDGGQAWTNLGLALAGFGLGGLLGCLLGLRLAERDHLR